MKPIKLYPLQANKTYIFSQGCKLADDDCILADFIKKQKENILSSRSDVRELSFTVCAGVGDGTLLCDSVCSHFFFVLEANDAEFICGGKKNVKLDINDLATFNTLKVKNGDYFTVPAGTVYSVGKGISYVEVYSNNSSLHRISCNAELVDISFTTSTPLLKKPAIKNDREGFSVKVLAALESFTVAQITVVGTYQNSIGSSYRFMFCLDGAAELKYGEGKVRLKSGDCYLLPANMGDFTISGGIDFLIFNR